jgi:hypothetical protein
MKIPKRVFQFEFQGDFPLVTVAWILKYLDMKLWPVAGLTRFESSLEVLLT